MKGYACYYGIKIYSTKVDWLSGGQYSNDCYIRETSRPDVSLWPGMNGNAPLLIQGDQFHFELYEAYGGYRFHAFPIFDKSVQTVFDGNTAAISGGAIFSGIDNSNIFIMDNTVFTKNKVTGIVGSGGALFLNGNSLVYIYSSFQENRAYYGGAVTVSQLNSPMTFSGCIFTKNKASNGGGVFLGDGNGNGVVQKFTSKSINFRNTKFLNNSASVSGGGMYLSHTNSATFLNSTFSGNSAHQDGGSLYADSQNTVQINGTIFNANHAGRYGGALSYFSGNSIFFNNGTVFSDNYAGSDGGVMYAAFGSSVFLFDKVSLLNNSCVTTDSKGGAVSLHEGSMLSLLGETSFIGNSVGDYGGAIYSSASSIALGRKSIVFSDNTAGQGSAIRLELMTQSSVTVAHTLPITPIFFLRNHCSKRGGTVSWIKDPSSGAGAFSKHTISNFDRFVWKNNTAVFGSLTSTQAISLGSTGANVTAVSLYNSELLPHPSISLLDYYLAQDLSDSSSTVTASVVRSSCINHAG
jgi:predicted outer membrane repeat protein